jgi:hypothetical protein
MTQFHENVLRHAQRHLLANREEIAASKVCGCVDCQAMFAPSAVERWVAEYGGETAICPKCGGDCVLGDASGYPAGDRRSCGTCTTPHPPTASSTRHSETDFARKLNALDQ